MRIEKRGGRLVKALAPWETVSKHVTGNSRPCLPSLLTPTTRLTLASCGDLPACGHTGRVLDDALGGQGERRSRPPRPMAGVPPPGPGQARPGREGGDPRQPALVALRTPLNVNPCEATHHRCGGCGGWWEGGRRRQEPPDVDLRGATAIAQHPIVAKAHEPCGEDMEQEASNTLVGGGSSLWPMTLTSLRHRNATVPSRIATRRSLLRATRCV